MTSLAPSQLVLVRHAESVGNLADRDARSRGASRLDLTQRDADVPLSPTGVEQAEALGRHLAALSPSEVPTAVISSPYVRGADTARRAIEGSGLDLPVRLDERLRERELGLFDGLTSTGIREEYPDEAERRTRLGKFYYRPPGGESWADVALRVRSLLRDLGPVGSQERLWVFTHQAVITCFRFVLEELTEAEVLEVDRTLPMPNGSTTAYARGEDGTPVLRAAADTTAVEAQGAPPTQEPEHAGRGEPR